jgi:hypothetical protein
MPFDSTERRAAPRHPRCGAGPHRKPLSAVACTPIRASWPLATLAGNVASNEREQREDARAQ